MMPQELTAALRRRAGELGFTLCGVCPAVSPPGASHLDEWLARGYAGQMTYLAERRAAYDHPRQVLEGARSVVMLALPYRTAEPAPVSLGQGRVARYAWGAADYHDIIRDKLHDLADHLRELAPDVATRGIVDTAPLNEREFAQLAGLGWIGKNTLLLNKHAGSYFFLAALLTDAELEYDAPHAADHCGRCTACLDACPTNAFPQPYVMDASRCISYLTIEHRDAIPAELRPGIGDWLFGCDVCQEVCPWNRLHPLPRGAGRGEGEAGTTAPPHPALSRRERDAMSNLAEFAPLPSANPIELAELFTLTEADFRRRFRHTPLWRPHRRGLLRNAAIVLGNQRDPAALPALSIGLQDSEPLVRAACVWAVGQINSPDAHSLLLERLADEADAGVLSEVRGALSEVG